MLSVRRLPVRWRLAITSAILTLVILIAFAVIVGRLATQRLRSDFSAETRSAASTLAIESHVGYAPGSGVIVEHPILDSLVLPNRASVRFVTEAGTVLARTRNAPQLGPPRQGLHHYGELQVAALPVLESSLGPETFVQYARSTESLEATIHRLWLFLAFGVIGGTALATLAGLAIAGRAMRPISSLTATAREIANTGDPSQRMPEPQTEDEIAELARTLDEMLRSLDASKAETQRAMQRQRELVADASHELRTPLTSVLANLELLESALDPSHQGEESEIIGSALRSSRRMSRLVSDLLLLARVDSGRLGGRSVCDLAAIVKDALAEIGPVAGEHSIRLLRSEPARLSCNADELHQLARNLLENAVRHTPAGSAVEVSVWSENGLAVLEVADDGPGIPDGLEEDVFGRFVRGAGPADIAGSGGTGLGLAIVRTVAESHGGSVGVERSQSGGARFRVELPAPEPQASSDGAEAPMGSPASF
ncbi:MAG: two-component system, OmpR family, sensor kinase [Solirubrobacterales bacterium]|nr:two-component system, OmpR family, sensor kinase [Solirubrobacterales bacterium]